MAGDPMHQNFLTFGAHFYGGVFNMHDVTKDSDLVHMMLSEEAWYQPFERSLHKKFPYLVRRVKGINDVEFVNI